MLEFDFRASVILSVLSLRNYPSPILPCLVIGFSTFAFSEKNFYYGKNKCIFKFTFR